MYSFEEITVGLTVDHEYVIDQRVYETFLSIFPDRSPVHVDDVYARANGFSSMVMHGAILNGFLSHFIGMRFPGARSLELSVDIRYLRPSYLGDRIRLEGKVVQKVESRNVVVVDLNYHNLTQGTVVARGRVQTVIMSSPEAILAG
jgi:3-hydroxybutyryl-CoA dehydratase